MENQDTFTEVTMESWGSRLLGSVKSVLLGLLLFIGAFAVLWFNEGRAVRTAKGLTEGASQVISISGQEFSESNSGKLVHITGKVTSEENLRDEEFNVDINAIKLSREVVMYQWVEKSEQKKEKEVGGSEKTTTVYNYEKEWSNSLVNSSEFKVPEGHLNPKGFPYASYTSQVTSALIGEYKLSESLIHNINEFTSYAITSVDTTKHKNAQILNEASANLSSGAKLTPMVFIGNGTSLEPQIGDVKITFKVVKPNEEYSVISQQLGNTFEPFKTATGTSIQMISKGIKSADNMFTAAQESNATTTWIIRLVGFFMMFIGLTLVFKPLVVIADVLPILGNILDFGLSLFCGLISFGLSFITIAIAWIVYRPVLGISLLVVGAGLSVFLLARKPRSRATAA